VLKKLNLPYRSPYQTRHTTATLWLGAGENPTWIAQQMGHTTTEMLFSTYARFVPNLTRSDGCAFEDLIKRAYGNTPETLVSQQSDEEGSSDVSFLDSGDLDRLLNDSSSTVES
jgi:integrase